MGRFAVVLVVAVIACTKSSPQQPPPPAEPPPPRAVADAAPPVDAAPPIDAAIAVDAGTPPKPAGKLHYRSDCSLTHPIARDVCSGAAPSPNGLKSCATLHIKSGDACASGAPRCWVPRTCDDGRVLPSDYLECAAEPSGRCFTRSSRQFKRDIQYLNADELADLATQVEALRIAKYRYKDSDENHLGFIIEDAPGAAFVTADGRRVDLYSLLSAAIVALQAQDARIKALEAKCTRGADEVESAHVGH